MTFTEIVLSALRTSSGPLASHQIYEHPACEGMTRQQAEIEALVAKKVVAGK